MAETGRRRQFTGLRHWLRHWRHYHWINALVAAVPQAAGYYYYQIIGRVAIRLRWTLIDICCRIAGINTLLLH